MSEATKVGTGDQERPSFAREFPRTQELDALVDAFVRGDYRRVRDEAPKLAASSEEPTVKEAARVLRERIEPDPLAKSILAGAAILLAVMTVWWLAHDGRHNVDHPSILAPASNHSD